MYYTAERLRADLVLAGKSPRTVDSYASHVRRFEEWVGQPASEVGEDGVRAFLLHLRERPVAPRTYVVYLAAICFVYRQTLGRPEVVEGLPRPKVAKGRRSLVPTVDEVRSILSHAPTPFVRTMLETAYACGLRSCEVRELQAGDIDSRHGLVHIRDGKGGKARSVMLGECLLTILRQHWRLHRLPGPWLFPVRSASSGVVWADQPMNVGQLGYLFRQARIGAGIRRRITMHGLRHAFATHLLEAGVDTAVLRVLMGHTDISTTVLYAAVRTDVLRRTPSPLDLLYTA